MVQEAPLIAVGTLDSDNRPWTALWGSKRGFCQSLGENLVGLRTQVDEVHDPVVQALCRKDGGGMPHLHQGKVKMFGGLTIDLERRNRDKLNGSVMAGAIIPFAASPGNERCSASEVQLIVRIDESTGKLAFSIWNDTNNACALGNCPKYLNRRVIEPAQPHADLQFDLPYLPNLPTEGLDIISKADLFFISTSH